MERKFYTSIWLNKPVSEVFPFFCDAKNLEKLTPPFLNFHILSQSTPSIQPGTTFEYQLKIRGIPVKWKSRIESWIPNEQFVDTQLKGPYSLWHHTHTFKEKDGGTFMEDIVRYALPLGKIGDFFGGWMVKRDVEKIFAYRSKIVLEIFGGRLGETIK